MEAILACHKALSTKWLDWVAKWWVNTNVCVQVPFQHEVNDWKTDPNVDIHQLWYTEYSAKRCRMFFFFFFFFFFDKKKSGWTLTYPSFCEFKRCTSPLLLFQRVKQGGRGSLCIVWTRKNSDMFTNLPSAWKTFICQNNRKAYSFTEDMQSQISQTPTHRLRSLLPVFFSKDCKDRSRRASCCCFILIVFCLHVSFVRHMLFLPFAWHFLVMVTHTHVHTQARASTQVVFSWRWLAIHTFTNLSVLPFCKYQL